jgi:hypothetical protein
VPPARTADHPDVYEIAYLAGGPPRVVDTALVALVETGRVRVHSPGQLAVAEPTRRHPVEAAVLDAIGTQGHRSVDTIRWRMADDDRIAALGRRLTAEGLLSRGNRVLRREAAPTRAGREVLRALAARPPADPASDGGSALLVALDGRDHLPDQALHAAIFEPPPVPVPDASQSRRRRLDVLRGDAEHAAYDPRGGPGGGAAGAGFVDGMGGAGL